MSDLNNDDRVKNRPKRIPLDKQNAYQFKKDPNFTYRIVNDVVGRIDAHRLAGWELDPSSEGDINSTKGIQIESQLGSVTKKVVNWNPEARSRYGYLMRKPLAEHEEDVKMKYKEYDAIEEQLDPEKHKQEGGSYGKMVKD